jgi:DNA-binding response OmpR family regulator
LTPTSNHAKFYSALKKSKSITSKEVNKMDEKKRILLFITTSTINNQIELALYRSYDITQINTATDLIHPLLQTNPPNAIIIDLDMVDERIKKLINEKSQKTAFIILSQNKSSEERIHAIENGADDCFDLTSLNINEFVAKINAIIRRINIVDHTPRNLQINDISINLDNHEVRKNGKLIDLTYTQFKLLYLLASKRNYIFTRNEILEKVWGENAYVTNRTVDVHVKRLRKKLGEDRLPSRYIQAIHGVGYKFF